MKSKPTIAITQGDPAGIGPEICLKTIMNHAVLETCRPVLIGDMTVLHQAARQLGLMEILSSTRCIASMEGMDLGTGEDPVLIDCGRIRGEVRPAVPTRESGTACLTYIETAVRAALDGNLDGIATAPINKTTLHLAGIDGPGHTEILGRLTNSDNFAMMLYSPRMAVSLVTCHQSLASVSASLDTEDIVRVVGLTRDTLRTIRHREPLIAILGLNPHAGEDGIFGNEEMDIISPAVDRCRDEGWNVEGPVSPDAAFMPDALGRYDGHVTLYHDQGCIPFKMISLHDGVNITMGLPIIRTSVDHGTAYDIAWQGKAGISSLISAIQLASELAAR